MNQQPEGTSVPQKEEEGKEKKGQGEGLGCGEWGLSNGEVCVVGRANAQDPQVWKRPWGLYRVGLRLKEEKGPRSAPHPWSQSTGDLTWEPSRLIGLEWVGQMPSSPLLLLQSRVGEGPSCLPLVISLASLRCPQDQCGRGLQGERGGLGGQGTSLGAQ